MAADQERSPDRAVAIWLLVVAAFVVATILVGGATRLTDSGLSITEWRPISGVLPPMSQTDWLRAFALYQTTTEYQQQNQGMTLADFRTLYWWEWGHRVLGRVIGVVFAVPFAFFWWRGRLSGRFWSVLGLGVLGGLQGAVGWWMVWSGLVGRLDVSPIRLAIHLGLAFIILGYAVTLALSFLNWPGSRAGDAGRIGRSAPAFLGVLFLQIVLGALVAGSDAGRAYSDWPTIGRELFPGSYAMLEPFWRNLTENHAALQFNHRTLGYFVAGHAIAIGILSWTKASGAARNVGVTVGALALLQVVLGVGTIVMGAPLSISLIHQGGAIALWCAGFAYWRVARYSNT